MASLDDPGVRLLPEEQVDHAVSSTDGADADVDRLAEPTRVRHQKQR